MAGGAGRSGRGQSGRDQPLQDQPGQGHSARSQPGQDRAGQHQPGRDRPRQEPPSQDPGTPRQDIADAAALEPSAATGAGAGAGTGAGTGARATTRLDKWLWQARFFRSRSLAAAAIVSGRLRVNASRVTKPAAAVGPGDTLTFVQAGRVRVIRILSLATRRGPAAEARTLYDDLSPVADQRTAHDGP